MITRRRTSAAAVGAASLVSSLLVVVVVVVVVVVFVVVVAAAGGIVDVAAAAHDADEDGAGAPIGGFRRAAASDAGGDGGAGTTETKTTARRRRRRRRLPATPDRGSGSHLNGDLASSAPPIKKLSHDLEHSSFLPPSDGEVAKRIVNGDPVPYGRYPYLASLSVLGHPDSVPQHKCTGTLIAPDVVLTGAHCVGKVDNVEMGRYDLDDVSAKPWGGDTGGSVGGGGAGAGTTFERFLIDTARSHPLYIDLPDEFAYDAAVLKLYGRSSLPPVGLNRDPDVPTEPGRELHVAGWGVLEYGSDVPSDVPMDVSVNYVPNEVCAAVEGTPSPPPPPDGEGASGAGAGASTAAFSYSNLIVPQMLCAYDEGEGACQGDSGGPLIVADEQFRGQFHEEFDGVVELDVQPVAGRIMDLNEVVVFEDSCGSFLEGTLEEWGGRVVVCSVVEQRLLDFVGRRRRRVQDDGDEFYDEDEFYDQEEIPDEGEGEGEGEGGPDEDEEMLVGTHLLRLTVEVTGTFDPVGNVGPTWEGFDLSQIAVEGFNDVAPFGEFLREWGGEDMGYFGVVEGAFARLLDGDDRRRTQRGRGRGRRRRKAQFQFEPDEPPLTSGADVQVGVVAFGLGCGQSVFPGIYTRVSSIVDDFLDRAVCELSGYVPDDFDCGPYGGARGRATVAGVGHGDADADAGGGGGETVALAVELGLGWFPLSPGFVLDDVHTGKVYAHYPPGTYREYQPSDVVVEVVNVPSRGEYRIVHLVGLGTYNTFVRVKANLTATEADEENEVLVEFDASENQYSAEATFVLGPPTPTPTSSPTISSMPSTSPAPTSAPTYIRPYVTLVLAFDYFPQETGWAIRRKGSLGDNEVEVVAYRPVGHYSYLQPTGVGQPQPTPVEEVVYLPFGSEGEEGEGGDEYYELTMYDGEGDGMCCTGGDGSYLLFLGPAPAVAGGGAGTLLLSGGQFKSTESNGFVVPPDWDATPSPSGAPSDAPSGAPSEAPSDMPIGGGGGGEGDGEGGLVGGRPKIDDDKGDDDGATNDTTTAAPLQTTTTTTAPPRSGQSDGGEQQATTRSSGGAAIFSQKRTLMMIGSAVACWACATAVMC